ncbi:MAG: hypothetical protein IKK59_07860 [Lachnospiraceae bacterium]|nr:hypothetical protein [Lachnospiraceae bacterium]MBR3762637.1 hypothetical protein [Lachnospiraceae bacterium]
MFKNCVFKMSVNTREWFKAAAVRAVKTMAQTAAASLTTAATIGEVDWWLLASTAVLAGIISLLMSIAGIPEVREDEENGD